MGRPVRCGMSPLVNDGAPESEETLAVWSEVRFGASVIVFEPAAEVGIADTDADTDAGAVLDPEPDADGDADPEFTAEGESVLDCPMDPRTLLRFWDAAAEVAWAELVALDMSLSATGS